MFGWDYVVELAKAKPIVLRDRRQQLDWLAHGKVAVLTAPKPDTLVEFIQAGAPIRRVTPEEGTWVSGGSSNMCVFNKSPHPNASKLFVNWLVSKEGSTVLCRSGGFHSTRLDVPTDHLAPEVIRDPKMKYVATTNENGILKKEELVQKAVLLLAPVTGK